MAITNITRDWSDVPSIVRAVSTDSLQVVTTAGYLIAQAANIQLLNNGNFEWAPDDSDVVLLQYGNGEGFFTVDLVNQNFVQLAPGGALLNYATVPITAAQFNGMYAAPVLLVPAQGVNTLILPTQVALVMTYNSAAYAAGGVAAVQWANTVNGAGVIATTTLAAATFQATASNTFVFNAGVVPAPFTTTVNKGLYLSNITGAFTTGDSPMVAQVWYKVIATA